MTEMPNRADYLGDLQALERVLTSDRPSFIFKHSTTCPTSKRAYDEFCRFVSGAPPGLDFFWVKVQDDRPIANEIAARLGVKHESPQLILCRNGQVLWHDSHGALTAELMNNVVARLFGRVRATPGGNRDGG